MIKLAFTENQWLTEVKYCDILIIFCLLVILGVLCLAADRMFHLPVFLGSIVFSGPNYDVLGRETDRTVSSSENQIFGED